MFTGTFKRHSYEPEAEASDASDTSDHPQDPEDLEYFTHSDRSDESNDSFPSTESGSRLPPQILRTCQRIHQEAALIPYAENFFIFEYVSAEISCEAYDPQIIEPFNAAQRRAVVSASLIAPCLDALSKLAMLLPGLKRLFLGLYQVPDCRCRGQLCNANGLCSIDFIVGESCNRVSNLNLVGAAAQVTAAMFVVHPDPATEWEICQRLERAMLAIEYTGDDGTD